MKYSVIVIEDDVRINNILIKVLKKDYFVYSVQNAKDGLDIIFNHNIDVILLDLGLPDMDGNVLIQKVREKINNPIIVISARSDEMDIVKALDLGADDYLIKPFRENELLSRIKNALKHSFKTNILTSDLVYEYKHFKIDFTANKVFINNKECNLTSNEYKILALLVKNRGKILTQKFIIKSVWGPNAFGESSSLRVHMANIRRKIEIDPANPELILTTIGIGYEFIGE